MIEVGSSVLCHLPGSWVDGKIGTVLKLNVVSSYEIRGHLLQMDNGTTIVESEHLELLS